jgi:xylan 1,4-beta-xylosidase
MRRVPLLIAFLLIVWPVRNTAIAQQTSYCNPLNIDYAYCAIPSAVEQGKHRATADPVIVVYKGTYFLFSTNQYGYWWSGDLNEWHFVPRRFLKAYHTVPDELCAPAAVVIGDSLLLIGSTETPDFPLWYSTQPTQDSWKEAVDSLHVAAWDPALFLDDDGRLYLYYGSSNAFPIYGQELDRNTFEPIGGRKELLQLHDDLHGWERFGEHADNTFLRPFIEGAWMTRHGDRYYLQYAAPGTEFSGYGDGVYVGDRPLGPFQYQVHNPFSYKPGGFVRGAGHGSTFQDAFGHWWHVATVAISVKNNFERRIGLWPSGFDRDGVLFCNTAYGDYPMFLPAAGDAESASRSTGWMLLNYNKPVRVSTTLGGYSPNFAVDEDIKTYWSASTADSGEWLESDLGSVSTVRALQINYADQGAALTGKQPGLFHRYRITASRDGLRWDVVVDKRNAMKDAPHDYVELSNPVEARYVRIQNVHVPTGTFALSGFRVFGRGHGMVPDTVQHFVALRGESERRNAWLKWQQVDDAVGYSIFCGVDPGKLYTSIMVYGSSEYYFTAMDRDRPYYFQIEAFNENGIGKRTRVLRVE